MKMFMALLLVLITGSAPLGADVLITEQVVAKAGGRDLNSTRSIAVKGAYMRIDVVQQAGESTSTIYDLPEGVTIALDAKKKRAELRDIAARAARLARDYPRARDDDDQAHPGRQGDRRRHLCGAHLRHSGADEERR